MLASIAMPTLLLYGELDGRSPVSRSGSRSWRRSPIDLVVLPGART
ncbi:MAG TPA: hypothetical protein VF165_11295 [Nocardioidaceae bacterium]